MSNRTRTIVVFCHGLFVLLCGIALTVLLITDKNIHWNAERITILCGVPIIAIIGGITMMSWSIPSRKVKISGKIIPFRQKFKELDEVLKN